MKEKETKKADNQEIKKKERRKPGILQWIYGILAVVLIIIFVYWTGYWVTIFFIPVFIDIYITKKINWNRWKEVKNPKMRIFLEWVDVLGVPILGIYLLNIFVVQNYQIPTSSLEKSLMVGDFLCVSKFSYGGRSPMTPLSLPLMQHTIPFLGVKSFLENPSVDYERFAGTGKIGRNDIVVFNYPSGDTVALKHQAQDYYLLCQGVQGGRAAVWADKQKYGDIVYRPADRRENYVKRCVGLPGETLSMRNDTVFIDGKPIEYPENVEHMYTVQTDGTVISPNVYSELGISNDDSGLVYYDEEIQRIDTSFVTPMGFAVRNGNRGMIFHDVNMTREMAKKMESKPFVWTVMKTNDYKKRVAAMGLKSFSQFTYPITYPQQSDQGDFPSIWIPKKGATVTFDGNVRYKVATYERCIKNYENNDFSFRDGKVYINGKQSDSYTFKFDYYFMMGDNRDNSADSRMWGFVPEDHVVGKPLVIWLSIDKDKSLFDGKIRWSRIFTTGNKK